MLRDMASLLPVPATSGSKPLSKSDQLAVRVGRFLALGIAPDQLAKHLAKGDPKKVRYWQKRIQTLLATNSHTQAQIAMAAQAQMWAGLIPATEALVRRASRGRPDAIKMLWSATGFHNDKVQHEHSGDIAITVKVARPTRVVDRTALDDPSIVDADVVED